MNITVDPQLLYDKIDCIGKGSFGEVFKGFVMEIGVVYSCARV